MRFSEAFEGWQECPHDPRGSPLARQARAYFPALHRSLPQRGLAGLAETRGPGRRGRAPRRSLPPADQKDLIHTVGPHHSLAQRQRLLALEGQGHEDAVVDG